MAIELTLSNFCIIKLSFFDNDFKDANYFLVKFNGALILVYELNDESALSLIIQSWS